MSLNPHNRSDRILLKERAAHESVSVGAADNLFRRDRIDWPVSGDESLLAHGYVGLRKAGKRTIWHQVELLSILSDPLLTD